MEESSTLKLIMEKGPREGETLEYRSRCVVKIGRVVRGNTFAIKDAGISSKHICIQFDNELSKWTLSDLDSSNGTILNGETIKPNVPSGLKDGDCIKIGEITSIIVKIAVESTIPSERKPRRQGKSGAAAVVESERIGLGLGFDGDSGENAVAEPVEKRNLRPRGKKAVDSKNEVETRSSKSEVEIRSSKRTMRSSRKEGKVNSIPTLTQIPENLNVDVRETTDNFVPIEPKKKGRKRKVPVQLPADIVVPIVEPLENAQKSSDLVDNLENRNQSVRVDVAEEAAIDKNPVDPLENVENSGLEANLGTNNESAQVHVAEKLVSKQEGCEGEEAMIDRSLVKGSSESAIQVHIDKDTGLDNSRWLDLEKMTLGDFFDYLEVQLPKEIYEKSEKVISHLAEKALKCHEFRLQKNENGN